MWGDCAHIRAWYGSADTRRTRKGAPAGRERAVTADLMAEWTGLEPATPGVTGRYSNQLNYHSEWNPVLGRSPGKALAGKALVGAEGFEPPTFAL